MLAAGSLLAAWPGTAQAEPTLPGELTNALVESVQCQVCHSFPNAQAHQADAPYAPFFGWQGSLMANAARDPVFWAGVALADQDAPGETAECIRCHSPRAFVEGRGDATQMSDLLPQDLEGVGCELCHRMTDQGDLGNAHYAIDDVPGPSGQVPRRGPWTYDMGSAQAPPHAWTQDAFTGSSQQCGTCHEVTTPRERVDDDGTPLGMPFNEQRTYSEWAGSVFAQAGDDFRSCQDCHMPAVADMPGCLDNVDQFSHATGGRRHDLVGANRFMLQVLQGEYGDAGTQQIPDVFFDMSMTRMDELLATAATLEVTGPPQVHLGDGLGDLVATVTNETGHKLPTGYSEGRVMWIEVIARYGEQTLWSSGEWTPGVGPADDPQLRTYQGVAEQYATGTTMHLLLNDHWVEDTRIPPRGLVPDIETDPVGDRYTLQDDGTWPHFDSASYTFPGLADVQDLTPEDATDDVLDVQVRLLYLINTPDYVQLLADDNTSNDAGNHVAMLFDTAGGAPPLVLAESSLSIPIVGFGAPPSDSTGTVDDTAGSAGTSDPGPTTGAPPLEESGSPGSGDTEPAQDDGGGGCSCTTDPAPTRAWWLLAPLALGLRRRRRAP